MRWVAGRVLSGVTLFMGATASPGASAETVPGKGGYELIWSDEFDTDGAPDPGKWAYDTHANKTGWYSGELQYYAADRPENVRVENGRLIITARKESLADRPDHGGQRYSSGRIVTQGKAAFTHGLIEVRAKLPCGAGLWPAIWTLGADLPWPDGGSIDILEFDQQALEAMGTVHNRSTDGTAGDGSRLPVPRACDAFHDYQLLWTPRTLKFAVDGKPFHQYVNAGEGMAQWPFDKPHYLILSLAIRPPKDGPPDDSALPARFEIEHVRVYRPAARGASKP